jgi:hypothetical protein
MSKLLWIPPIGSLALLAGGCLSWEGTYAPSCAAYAGSRIELAGGRFDWDRFTDQVMVDADGKVVDPFPGYPLHGGYRIEGHTVLMTSADGEALAPMHLLQDGGVVYLYTEAEFAAWQANGERAPCPLALER